MARAGDRIGPYVLSEKLGRGAFGVVWLAERRSAILTRHVALKMPNDEDVDLEAVKREAAVWAHAAGHPNVLPIIDADIYDGQVVIASEYAPDGSLSAWLKRHGGTAPSAESAAKMVDGILTGLEHLHSRRVIHRDLKPDNILLQGETPRLADFGIARVLKTVNSSYTVASGTPRYMAPEAYKGERSEQTDVWAVGVILHQLLSGVLPYPQEDSYALMYAVFNEAPAPLPASVPDHLRRITARAMEKDPERRYRTAGQMREAIRRYLTNAPDEPDEDDQTEVPTVTDLPRATRETPPSGDIPIGDAPEIEEEEETVLRQPSEQAVEFTGGDEAYLRWLSQNSAGYVVNTARAMHPNYMVLHRATCPHVSELKPEQRGGFTERGYIKICSPDVEPLREWVKAHGRPDGSFSRECSRCDPLGDSLSGVDGGEGVARIEEPVMAISIGGQYPNVRNADDLYHATRGAWRINKSRAEKAVYAFAVYKGEVKEVYKIHEWRPASPELFGILERMAGRQRDDSPVEGDTTRSEFIGELAPEAIRKKYVGKRLPRRSYGAPILYFNC